MCLGTGTGTGTGGGGGTGGGDVDVRGLMLSGAPFRIKLDHSLLGQAGMLSAAEVIDRFGTDVPVRPDRDFRRDFPDRNPLDFGNDRITVDADFTLARLAAMIDIV